MRKVKELDPYIKSRVGEALIQLDELTNHQTDQALVDYIILVIGQKIFTITIQKNKQRQSSKK